MSLKISAYDGNTPIAWFVILRGSTAELVPCAAGGVVSRCTLGDIYAIPHKELVTFRQDATPFVVKIDSCELTDGRKDNPRFRAFSDAGDAMQWIKNPGMFGELIPEGVHFTKKMTSE